jgi:hypothetical protein
MERQFSSMGWGIALALVFAAGCSKATLINRPPVSRKATAPTFFNIIPSTGPTAGNMRVTITGTGFVNGMSVYLDNNLCLNIVVVSSTSLTCTTPAHILGNVSVTLRAPSFSPVETANAYVYFDVSNPIPGFAVTNGGGATFTVIPGQNQAITAIGEVQQAHVVRPPEADIQHRVGVTGTDPMF